MIDFCYFYKSLLKDDKFKIMCLHINEVILIVEELDNISPLEKHHITLYHTPKSNQMLRWTKKSDS